MTVTKTFLFGFYLELHYRYVSFMMCLSSFRIINFIISSCAFFLAYFPSLKKQKGAHDITLLSVCVSVLVHLSMNPLIIFVTRLMRSLLCLWRSRDSSVGIAAGHWLDDTGSIPDIARFFSSQGPDRPSGPHILLSNGYRRSLPEVKATVA
jgi:hypothetical protein